MVPDGPLGGQLLRLDILAPALCSYSLATLNSGVPSCRKSSALVPAPDGRLILLGQTGVLTYDQTSR
jgi:hypothetical protein